MHMQGDRKTWKVNSSRSMERSVRLRSSVYSFSSFSKLGNIQTSYNRGELGCGSVAEHLPGMHEALGLIPSIAGGKWGVGFLWRLGFLKNYYAIR